MDSQSRVEWVLTDRGSGYEQRGAIRLLVRQLLDLQQLRDIAELHHDGTSQHDIEQMLGISSRDAERGIALAAHTQAESPTEVIVQAYLLGTSRGGLVDQLSRWPFAFPEVVSGDGVTEATWQEVVVAAARGLLSPAEYQRVCDAVQPPPPGEPPEQG